MYSYFREECQQEKRTTNAILCNMNAYAQKVDPLGNLGISSYRGGNHTNSDDQNNDSVSSQSARKTLRDRLKDFREASAQDFQRTKSISPIRHRFDNHDTDMLPSCEKNKSCKFSISPHRNPKREVVRDKRQENFSDQREKVTLVHKKQESQKGSDQSFAWNEEEEDTRGDSSTMSEENMKKNALRNKLVRIYEGLLAKKKLSDKVSKDISFPLRSQDLNVKENFKEERIASPCFANNLKENRKKGKENTKFMHPSQEENGNYAKIVHLESNPSTDRENNDFDYEKGRRFVFPSMIQPSIFLGLTKLQLFIQQNKFKSLNSSFQSIKNQSLLKDTYQYSYTTRGDPNTSRVLLSFRASTSLISQKNSKFQLSMIILKNVLIKHLQSAFFSLKSSVSLQNFEYKTSIMSGVLVLSKLLNARERSLCSQCLCIWKLKNVLQIQRDREIANKNKEIEKLLEEENKIFCRLIQQKSNRQSPEPNQQSFKQEKKGQIRNPRSVDKENNEEYSKLNILGIKGLKKHETNENNQTLSTKRENNKINQILDKHYKVLNEQKQFQGVQNEGLMPDPMLNNNVSYYQKPFLLGQPTNNMKYQNKNPSRIHSSSERSGISEEINSMYLATSYSYNSTDSDFVSNRKGNSNRS